MDFDSGPVRYAPYNFGQYAPALDLNQSQIVPTICDGKRLEINTVVVPTGHKIYVEDRKVEHFFVLGKCPNCDNLVVGEVVVHPDFVRPVTLLGHNIAPPPFEFSAN